MKDFFKMAAAAAVGCLVVGIAAFLFMLVVLSAISAIGTSQPVMPREAVLKVDMSEFTISEQAVPADLMSSIKGESRTSLGIWTAIRAIREAAMDPAVKSILLKPDGAAGDMAGIEEFRTALERFRESGKPVISFIQSPSSVSYYLASVSDRIFLSNYSGGMNTILGFSSQMVFLKDILDKLGVNVQLIRHGKYKSAGEMYIKNEISPENREQNQVLVNSLWNGWAARMAGARDLSTENFNYLVDALKLNDPEDFLEYGLVDELVTREELEERLCGLFGAETPADIHQISLADYATLKVVPNFRAKDKVAVIYACGNIVDEDDKSQVSGDRFASIIADVRKDLTVKAVVLRVNSPGGSVVASDKIRTEIDLLKEVKPVIASYGSYAASGGYWISSSCDKIYSDACTITGSIGVFSMIPDFSRTYSKVGVSTVVISSNDHGAMYSGTRPLTADETAYMQASVEDIYETFTSLVAQGRSLEQSYVDDIAQGRVWAGTDAYNIGLVDEIGGLEDAVNYAISVSGRDYTGMDSLQIVEYPKPLTTMDMILEAFGQSTSVFAGTPYEYVERSFKDWNESNAGQVYARLPYEITVR